MDLDQLKEKLLEVGKNQKELLAQYNADLLTLKCSEREMIEDYLSSHAKYRTNEIVLLNENRSNRWIPCYVGLRDINRDTWEVEYYIHHIKKDGTPAKARSPYPFSENCIKPYKKREP